MSLDCPSVRPVSLCELVSRLSVRVPPRCSRVNGPPCLVPGFLQTVWTMSLLRAAIAAHAITDTHHGDAPSILTLLVGDTSAQQRNQRAFDRECDECDAIVQARPRGADVPRIEPKSIHSPAGAARIRWQPPTPKGTGPRKQFAQT
jgi:hypothetical protein